MRKGGREAERGGEKEGGGWCGGGLVFGGRDLLPPPPYAQRVLACPRAAPRPRENLVSSCRVARFLGPKKKICLFKIGWLRNSVEFIKYSWPFFSLYRSYIAVKSHANFFLSSNRVWHFSVTSTWQPCKTSCPGPNWRFAPICGGIVAALSTRD